MRANESPLCSVLAIPRGNFPKFDAEYTHFYPVILIRGTEAAASRVSTDS